MDADIHSLLERPAWIKQLARNLAADASQADDLVQDTWLAALTRPPRPGVPIRRWVAKVMRNAVAQRQRVEGRRNEREALAARGELDLSSEELLARLDVQRSIADAVAALGEPYRTAILLRYFEDLPPRRIAVRLGVPVRTVHSRLHRGLELLRTGLEPQRPDDRKAWALGLAAFGRGTPPLEPNVLGALLMSTKVKLAVGVVAAAGLLLVARTVLLPERAPVGESAGRATLAGVLPTGPVELESPDETLALQPAGLNPDQARTPLALPPSPPLAVETSATNTDMVAAVIEPLAGRVIDLASRPVSGVPVIYVPFGRKAEDCEPVLSDRFGRFEFANPHPSGQIDAAGDDWATVLQPRRLDFVSEEPVLVVAPAITLSGVVRDEDGVPVTGAKLSLGLPGGLRAKLDAIVDESHTREWAVESDEHGRFELARVPSVIGSILHVSAPEHTSVTREAPLNGDVSLQIVLQRSLFETPNVDFLEGLILDSEGQPVPEAWASLGDTSSRADDEGRFRIDVSKVGEERVLSASAKHYLPTELAGDPGSELLYAFPEPLVMVLSSRPGKLIGRVLDSEGRPAVGVQVWTPDETHFGTLSSDSDPNNFWASGVTIEEMARGDVDFWSEALSTNEQGEFELDGLMPHPYVVYAWDDRTHGFAQSEPVLPNTTGATGERVELRLPPAALRPRTAGIVLGLGAAPVVGAKVKFGTELRTEPSLAGSEARVEFRNFPETLTDEQGRFELVGVPLSARRIRVEHGGVADAYEEQLDESTDFEALEIRVPLRCRVQVVLGSGLEADRLQVLDEEEEPMALVVKHGWVAMGSHWQTFQEGRTEVLRVSERARTLVLYRADEEVARLPLQLDPGELVIVRP